MVTQGFGLRRHFSEGVFRQTVIKPRGYVFRSRERREVLEDEMISTVKLKEKQQTRLTKAGIKQ